MGSSSPLGHVEHGLGGAAIHDAKRSSVSATSLRRSVVAAEVPIALYLAAGLVAAAGAVELGVSGITDTDSYAGAILVSVVLATVGVLTHRVAMIRSPAAWVFATAMVLTAGWMIQVFLEAPGTARTGYIAIILMSLGFIILEWLPWLTASLIITSASLIAATSAQGAQWTTWLAVCLVAMAVGSILMFLRRRSLAAIAEARQLAEDRAITDTLTGLLNRTGVKAMIPGLWATANRLSQPIVVAFVDVDGLKAANDTHGHDFGDDVIKAVADALRSTMRQGDILARWGGDEFIAIGMGIEPDAATLQDRLQARLSASGIDPAMWPGRVSVGTAHAMPQTATIDTLISEADARMYQARRARRDSQVTGNDQIPSVVGTGKPRLTHRDTP